MIESVKAWLTNRFAWVKVNGTLGRWRTFNGGNAARISSLATIFIIFINDLLRQFDESTMVTAYADGLAKACR